MAAEKVLLRDFTLHINTGTISTPVWTQVLGLHPELEWSADKSNADTSDQDSAGFPTHVVSTIAYKASVKGKRMEDPDAGTRDPGQDACETLDAAVGSDSVGNFKITSPGGSTIVYLASVSVKPFGGGENDSATWELEMTVSGEPTWA